MAVSYHFLRVAQAKPGWAVMGSGTDHTEPLYVAHDDVEEEEEAGVLVVWNPSSPFSPVWACSWVPEKGSMTFTQGFLLT